MWKDYYERQQKLKQDMLTKLEKDSSRLDKLGNKLDTIIDETLDRLDNANKQKNITPYKMAVATSKMIDGITKLQKQSMDIYDRIHGVVLGSTDETIEETVDVDSEEVEQTKMARRHAEKLVLLLVQSDEKKPHPDQKKPESEAS